MDSLEIQRQQDVIQAAMTAEGLTIENLLYAQYVMNQNGSSPIVDVVNNAIYQAELLNPPAE